MTVCNPSRAYIQVDNHDDDDDDGIMIPEVIPEVIPRGDTRGITKPQYVSCVDLSITLLHELEVQIARQCAPRTRVSGFH